MSIEGLNPQQYNIQSQFGYHVVPKQVSEGQQQTSSARENLYNKLNSLDGTFEKNRANIYATPSAVTAPKEIGSIHSTEKNKQSEGLADKFANGEISTTDAIAILNDPKNQELLLNSDQFKDEIGKSYDLNDGEFHPVYRELAYDYMA